jgi:hypothetical protein
MSLSLSACAGGRRAEALVTHGRHCLPRGAPASEERWEPMRTRQFLPAVADFSFHLVPAVWPEHRCGYSNAISFGPVHSDRLDNVLPFGAQSSGSVRHALSCSLSLFRRILHDVSLSRFFARAGGRRASRRWGVAPADCSPASLDTGPVRSTAQTDHSLLRPDILTAPSCPRGFDLVAGVTRKSTASPSNLRPPSFVLVQSLQ